MSFSAISLMVVSSLMARIFHRSQMSLRTLRVNDLVSIGLPPFFLRFISLTLHIYTSMSIEGVAAIEKKGRWRDKNLEEIVILGQKQGAFPCPLRLLWSGSAIFASDG